MSDATPTTQHRRSYAKHPIKYEARLISLAVLYKDNICPLKSINYVVHARTRTCAPDLLEKLKLTAIKQLGLQNRFSAIKRFPNTCTVDIATRVMINLIYYLSARSFSYTEGVTTAGCDNDSYTSVAASRMLLASAAPDGAAAARTGRVRIDLSAVPGTRLKGS